MKLKYVYTRVNVSNLEKSKDFYQETLGLKLYFKGEGYVELATGNTRITLLQQEKLREIIGSPNEPIYAERDDRIALSFEVPDLEEACQELENKGIKLLNQPWSFPDWGYKAVFFRDPDGHLIEIAQLLS